MRAIPEFPEAGKPWGYDRRAGKDGLLEAQHELRRDLPQPSRPVAFVLPRVANQLWNSAGDGIGIGTVWRASGRHLR